jgi:hypothetical protein
VSRQRQQTANDSILRVSNAANLRFLPADINKLCNYVATTCIVDHPIDLMGYIDTAQSTPVNLPTIAAFYYVIENTGRAAMPRPTRRLIKVYCYGNTLSFILKQTPRELRLLVESRALMIDETRAYSYCFAMRSSTYLSDRGDHTKSKF